MRPNKQINSGAHRSGPAVRGKARYFSTGLPAPTEEAPAEAVATGQPAAVQPPPSKYDGRATVGRIVGDDEVDVAVELAHEEWVDPLDMDEFDLSKVTIDLRESQRPNPPETYYQRYSSRVPGHQ